MTELSPGESVDMDTRVGGGPVVRRDAAVEDAYHIDEHGGELSRDEIRRFAEAAGFEVHE